MIYNGVKLYHEADTYEEAAGILLSYCHPPNPQAVHSAHSVVTTCLHALKDYLLLRVERNYPNGVPNTIERKKYNWTRSAIKRSNSAALEKARKSLSKNVWKG